MNGAGRWHAALSGALLLAAGGAASAADSEFVKTVRGYDFYLGVMPAEIVRGHPKTHPEGEMHGGAPAGARARHVTIAIFERQSGRRITQASVSARVEELSHVGESKPLQPMTIAQAVTYGNWFTMSSRGPYLIRVEARVPGETEPLKVEFRYRPIDS